MYKRQADDDALAVALDHYLDTFHLALVAAGVGSVDVRVADDEWALGSGTVVAAALRVAARARPGDGPVVALLADSWDRYTSKPWME